ncbi:MAG TPA: c-type cytochrome [Allosphingosinicella sp.]|jgi:cytochrome c2
MPSRNRIFASVLGVALLAAAAVAAFFADRAHERDDLYGRATAMTGGDIGRGRAAFAHYGCGGCHALKGVSGASGLVGPPLDGVSARAIIGGRLENKPDNMMRWIRDPQGVSPGTAMPQLGVTPGDSRDIAAFLYTRT